jgi:hypothetical protein
MPETVQVAGVSYEVLAHFGEGRVLARYDGEAVFVDRNPDGATWDLSGQPASTDAERAAVVQFMPSPDATGVAVVKDA